MDYAGVSILHGRERRVPQLRIANFADVGNDPAQRGLNQRRRTRDSLRLGVPRSNGRFSRHPGEQQIKNDSEEHLASMS